MRLIDADALKQELLRLGFFPAIVARAIENAPAVEMEVVRCRDCKFWDGDRRCNGIKNGLVMDYTRGEDFCSYGERK